jgi:hypothetical protein
VWGGPAAQQQIVDEAYNVHLPGGKEQIFIPLKLRTENFESILKEISLPW